VSEKIRAASQRSKIRDLHDLLEVAGRQVNRDLVRPLADIKLWESNKGNLDYAQFAVQIEGGKDYDLRELENLLRKDQRPDLKAMISRVTDGFRFLGQMSDLESKLAQNKARRCKAKIDQLKAAAVKRAG
jgi:hypothetical protein